MRAERLQQRNTGFDQQQRGFSFVELMITLVVGALLLSVAVPSFQGLMTGNRLTATTNTLVFSLQTARSEAIKRALPAAVCTSSNALSANATCSAGSGYVGGWIAYVDDNGNGSRDAAEDVVMAVEDRGAGFTITPDAVFQNQIYFDDGGGSSNAAGVPLSGSIGIRYGDGTESRTVQVSATGRVSTTN